MSWDRALKFIGRKKNRTLSTLQVFLLSFMINTQVYGSNDLFFEAYEVKESEQGSVRGDNSLVGLIKISEDVGFGLSSPPEYFSRNNKELTTLKTSAFGEIKWSPKPNYQYVLGAEVTADLVYKVKGYDNFSDDELNNRKTKILLKEAYFSGLTKANIGFKVGNQIYALGLSEIAVITDVINPRDNEYPGQEEVEDRRVHIPIATITSYLDHSSHTLIVAYGRKSNVISSVKDDFDPYYLLSSDTTRVTYLKPSDSIEFLLHSRYEIGFGELNLVLGQVNDNESIIDSIKIDQTSRLAEEIRLRTERYDIYGIYGSYLAGSWLLKSEFAIHNGVGVSQLREVNTFDITDADRSLASIGAEFHGFTLWNIGFEYSASKVQVRSGQTKTNSNLGVRATWSDRNSRYRVNFFASSDKDFESSILRLSLVYDWSDHFSLGVKWVGYGSNNNEAILYQYRNNDIVQISLNYAWVL